jgi:hypothetical protein
MKRAIHQENANDSKKEYEHGFALFIDFTSLLLSYFTKYRVLEKNSACGKTFHKCFLFAFRSESISLFIKVEKFNYVMR